MKIFLYLLFSIILTIPASAYASVVTKSANPAIPFYSQFKDISSAKWQKVGCGVASLAMIIDYYKPAVSVNTLLTEAIALGAYSDAGWTYSGLIASSKKYGMTGASYDLASSNIDTAFSAFSKKVDTGPVIASVHYKFDPKSTIPHLVVITSIQNGLVYYNDPAATTGGKSISVSDFKKAWKKRYIVLRPSTVSNTVAVRN